VPLQGWTNTSWDTVANGGIYRPGVEQAHEDQLARLRGEEPTVSLGTSASPVATILALLCLIVVISFIFFPEQLAAIFA